jgi:hypothetical protein
VLALLTAFALQAAGAAPPEPLLVALGEIRDGARPCKELRVRYQDGNEEHGKTVIGVMGRWARVVRTEPGAESVTHRGSIGGKLCVRIARVLLDGELWKARVPKKHKPSDGETRPSITVRVKGYGSFKRTMWGYSVQESAVFAKTRANMLLVARRVSDLQVLY